MIYLKIFLTFLKIGAISFGGGYGMVSVLEEEVISHGWLEKEEFLNFIAVSESTPGPLAVNMATFIGSSQGGFFGALLATLGVVLPSFLIILLIVALLQNLLKYAGVNAALNGIRPCIAGLITATALTMILSTVFGFEGISSGFDFDIRCVAIFFAMLLITVVFKKIRKKSISPIILILISAVFGILLF